MKKLIIGTILLSSMLFASNVEENRETSLKIGVKKSEILTMVGIGIEHGTEENKLDLMVYKIYDKETTKEFSIASSAISSIYKINKLNILIGLEIGYLRLEEEKMNDYIYITPKLSLEYNKDLKLNITYIQENIIFGIDYKF